MRVPVIAGNWKMYTSHQESVALATDISANTSGGYEVVVCPPSVHLESVCRVMSGSRVGVGAQNAYSEKEGAFTGEISCEMIRSVGGTYVILGHSERRQIFGESDTLINSKVKAAQRADLVPILCVGETLDEEVAGDTVSVITRQLSIGLESVPIMDPARLIIAYEPVWAIGTGKVATPGVAEAVHSEIRRWLFGRYADQADQIRILYGGSVKPDNVASLMAQPNIDGALVGGASLKSESFLSIINAASPT